MTLTVSVSARMSLLTVGGVADQPANCSRSWPQRPQKGGVKVDNAIGVLQT